MVIINQFLGFSADGQQHLLQTYLSHLILFIFVLFCLMKCMKDLSYEKKMIKEHNKVASCKELYLGKY